MILTEINQTNSILSYTKLKTQTTLSIPTWKKIRHAVRYQKS